MSPFSAEAVRWKSRRAVRLCNGKIEITVLLGGGHIADFRLCGSNINALWEAPWPTIEPYEFSDAAHAVSYGEGAVGQMLSGYSGHALAIPYFGMPSAADASRGLALHGEAACTEWQIAKTIIGDTSASVTLQAALPLSQFHVRRTLQVSFNSTTVAVTESVRNTSNVRREFEWVEHTAFGEPLFTAGESYLFLTGDRAVTWPLGYEGRELVQSDFEFQWPRVAGYDLSSPFLKERTGFVAAVRLDPRRTDGSIAVHNRRHGLIAGYVFEASRFPWIALWEENCARDYPPWIGRTRVRGVEFGTSPMPLGLGHAQQMRSLFDTPVLATIDASAELTTRYQAFVAKVPHEWHTIRDVRGSGERLIVTADNTAELLL